MKQTDLAELTNAKLYEQKLVFVEQAKSIDVFEHTICVNYHGIKINIECSRVEIINLIKKLIPSSWTSETFCQDGITLKLLSSKEFNLDGSQWEDEGSPECIITFSNGGEVAVQRDFAAVAYENKMIAIINEEIADGFYNVLRWFMPRKMIEKGQTVLHSSCVVTGEKASFFLGHSGYGKSTLTELAGDRIILGDDMNILTSKNGEYFAEGAALGGLYDNQRILGKTYPVKAFYWLHKSDENKVEKMDMAEASRKLISSCANVFWGRQDKLIEEAVMKLSMDIVSKYSFYNLYFRLDKGFWEYVK